MLEAATPGIGPAPACRQTDRESSPSMHGDKIIAREPFYDLKGQVFGYELACQHQGAGLPADTDLEALASLIAGCLNNPISGWKLGSQLVFIEASPALLRSDTLKGLRPQNTVLTMTMADLCYPDTLNAVRARRREGFGLCLRNASAMEQDKFLLDHASHIELNADTPDLWVRVPLYRIRLDGGIGAASDARRKPAGRNVRLVARNIGTWQQHEVCTQLRLDAFSGKVFLTPQPARASRNLSPVQSNILLLMDLVRQEASARELEKILKRDAAMSFKLLRYVNSAGFGLGTEIQSLPHAVMICGYATLYKWLSLLFASTIASGSACALMPASIIRGRFTELLGHGLLAEGELANLFVIGMFSLLDRMLGVPMEQAVEKIRLSDDISKALLLREGIGGAFLKLVEECENVGGNSAGLAESLLLSPAKVNQAHLTALAWAEQMSR